MSVRSMRRARRRELERVKERSMRRAAVMAAVGGAGLVAAPAAHAEDFTVTNTDDSGPGSLRQAVLDANAVPSDDRILFDSSVTGEIRLTSGEIAVQTDGLAPTPIYGNLTIDGPGSDVLTLSGDADDSGGPTPGDSRVFRVNGNTPYGLNGAFEVSGLTFADSLAPGFEIFGGKYAGSDGGAISAATASLTVTDSIFDGNAATKYGGAITSTAPGATILLEDLTLTGNRAAGSGGAIAVSEASVSGMGEALEVDFRDSVVSGNASGVTVGNKYGGPAGGGGAAIRTGGAGGLEVSGVDFTGNTAVGSPGQGGALRSSSYGTTQISDSTFSGNSATYGGALYDGTGAVLERVEITGNTATGGGGGFQGSGASIRHSAITDNEVQTGNGAGGVTVFGPEPSEIVETTVSGNSAPAGVGGVYGATVDLRVNRSTVSGNTGTRAGGIFAVDRRSSPYSTPYVGLHLVDSTVAGNAVVGGVDNGLYNEGWGGGVHLRGEVGGEILNSTIAGNSASLGGGGVFSYAGTTTPAAYYEPQPREISSTIVADNTADGSADDLFSFHRDPGDDVIAGFSLIEALASDTVEDDPAGSNLFAVDPELGVLKFNSGPTQTMLPSDSSPVVDAGAANGLTVDQRNRPRTIDTAGVPNADDGTDIGAVELGLPSNVVRPSVSGTLAVGEVLTADPGTWRGDPTAFRYQWQRCDAAGTSCVDIPEQTRSTYRVRPGDEGRRVRVRVRAVNDSGSATASSVPTKIVGAPALAARPQLSGDALTGERVQTTTGQWDNNPTSFEYQWQRCDADRTTCTDIPGATFRSYRLKSADEGSRVRVVVTADNATGSTQAYSNYSAVVR